MPNIHACTNRRVRRKARRLAVFKECFAAVIGASSWIVMSSMTMAQADREQFFASTPDGPPGITARHRPLPGPTNYLPASPWSNQTQHEQLDTPEFSTVASGVTKETSRSQQAERAFEKPAGLRWGSIREITAEDEETIEHAEPTESSRRETLVVNTNVDTHMARLTSSREEVFHNLDGQETFYLPDRPMRQDSSVRSVGQFASSRESVTKESYDSFQADPIQFPETVAIQPTIQEAERMRVAQMQSHELQSASVGAAYAEPQLLESPIGWKAIREELAKHLEACDSLLKRGATHSARAEILVGLRKLFRTMDLHRGVNHSENCFEAALIAMREEADFHNLQMSRSVATTVAMHTTPALKNRPLDSVTTELACQHYRAYARYQLLQAADGHLYAADLLYALGKTLEKDAELTPDRAQQLRSQAVICYQSAIQLRPNQHHASNQLGYALIHLDRIEEAFEALRSSIEAKPSAAAWTNLAEIYRRRGAVSEANYAAQQARSFHGRESPESLQITQVDPAVFARYSPALNANSTVAPHQTAQASANAPLPEATAKTGNFFTKMFR